MKMRAECNDSYYIAANMWLKRPETSFGREARAVANILHAGAKLKVDSHHDVMKRLLNEALRMSEGFQAQEAANSIWAVATMGVDDSRIVNGLARACVARVRDFNPQDAANSIWAVATLGVTDKHVISSLSKACVARVKDFNPRTNQGTITFALHIRLESIKIKLFKWISIHQCIFTHCSYNFISHLSISLYTIS
jgi:predicted lipoprotein